MKRLTESQKNAIARLRKAGKGYKIIAEKLSLSRETVRGFCMRHKELINDVSVNDDKTEAAFTKGISSADISCDVEDMADLSADISCDVEVIDDLSADISRGEENIADLSVDIHCAKTNINNINYGADDIGDLCKNCGKPVEQTAGIKHRVFCSKKCRQDWWNSHPEAVNQKAIYVFVCPNCGSTFTVYGNKHRKYCSHACYIADRFRKAVTL